MTYSLHTLHADTLDEIPEPSGWVRFASEITFFFGFFVLAFLLLAFASYAPQDAAWTTSGDTMPSQRPVLGWPVTNLSMTSTATRPTPCVSSLKPSTVT